VTWIKVDVHRAMRVLRYYIRKVARLQSTISLKRAQLELLNLSKGLFCTKPPKPVSFINLL